MHKQIYYIASSAHITSMALHVPTGKLLATFSRKTKSQVVESRITLLVWSCLSLVEKQRTINHMIFFNDSISKFYQCGAFAEAYLYFLATKKKKMLRQ